jgi:outer membrane protein
VKSLKNLFNLHVLLATVCLSLVSYCWADKATNPVKIGVVKVTELESSTQFKKIQEKLDKEFSTRKDSFFAKRQDLQNKFDLFQRDKAILSDKERNAKDRELTKLEQEINHLGEALDTEAKSRYQEELMAFHKAVSEAVAKVAKKDGYDLILLDQVVLYNSMASDCTNQVIAMLR